MDDERDAGGDKDVLFHMPAPPPFPPAPFPPGHVGRVVYFERELEDGERETEDLMLRSVPREVAMRFRAAAGGRSFTYAQYLAALVALHESIRGLAADDARVAAELERLGLQTVTV